MNKLIRGEFYKLSKLAGYKVLLCISAGVGLLIGFFILVYEGGATGYSVFRILLVWPLFSAIVAGVYTAIFLCGEFMNRTYGISLLCGLSRRNVFLAKMIVFFCGLLPVLYMNVIIVTIFAAVKNGFGTDLNAGNIAELIKMFFYSVLGYLAMGGYFSLLAVLIKNPIGTIGAGIGGVYVQLILWSSFRNADAPLLKLSFVYQLNQFLDWESFQDGMFLAVIISTFAVTLTAALFLFERAELK